MTPTQEFRFLVLAAQRTGSRILTAALKPLGLTPAQAEVLQVLEEFGPMSLATLGTLLVCESGSPSRLVAGLVQRALVVRKASSDDGRAVELDLTAAGRATLQQTRPVEREIARAIEARLSPREIAALVKALRKIVADAPPGVAVARRRQGRG